jgi:NADPH-dependent 2,4-dienoyl-CoA reductase/sulfur reductase-like enzyme
MGERVCAAMGRMGFAVHPDQAVREVLVDGAGRARGVRTDAGSYDADLVVLGLGMGPETRLAAESGLSLGTTGALDVDHGQRCRDHPEVLAAGDCAQTFSRITGEVVHVPLGTHANAQGRVAGSVAAGRPARFPGVLGTALTRIGDLEVGRTGLCTTQAEAAGFAFRADTIEATTQAGYLPGAADIAVKVITEEGSGRLLGGQVVGGPGAGKRIDVLATAIWAGMTADELAGADLSYAPPFGPASDPVAVAARVAARG